MGFKYVLVPEASLTKSAGPLAVSIGCTPHVIVNHALRTSIKKLHVRVISNFKCKTSAAGSSLAPGPCDAVSKPPRRVPDLSPHSIYSSLIVWDQNLCTGYNCLMVD